MKAEIKEIQEKKFNPFKIEFTVESIEEARLLFHVFNNSVLRKCIFHDDYYYTKDGFNFNECSDGFSGDTWKKIKNIIESQGFEL